MASIRRKIHLVRGLLNGEEAFTGPFYVTIDLTRRCNLRCPGCYRHSNEADWSPSNTVQDIPFDLFSKLCKELREMGTNEIILLGEGEPCLHPDLADILGVASSRGFRTTLVTNGTLLDDDVLEAVVGSGLDNLKVSLWANEPEEHSAGPTGFNRVMEGIKRVVTRRGPEGPRVTLHRPISRGNFEHLESVIDHARDTGCDRVSFSPLREWSPELSYLSLLPEQLAQIGPKLRRIADRLESAGLGHNLPELLQRYQIGGDVNQFVPCFVSWYHARVRVDGTVVPCATWEVPLGNLNDSTFAEIWNELEIRSFRRKSVGLGDSSTSADLNACNYCCHVLDNVRIDTPLSRIKKARFWGS